MASLAEWVKQTPSDDFWLVALLMIALSVAGFIGAFYYFKRKRIIEDTPTSRIRSCPQGYVELQGHGDLMEGPPIKGPLTGKICTWYSYQVEEYRRSGKNSRWVTVEKGASEELFFIIDDTGQCVIDPEGASVTSKVKDVWRGSTKRPSSGPRTGGSALLSLAGGRYRYTERRMHPKEPLYSIGLFKTVGGSGTDFNVNEDVRELLAEWKRDSNSLLNRFDKNKDGEIDMQEWEQVRETALKEVMARHSETKAEAPVNTLSKTMDSRRPFLLSAVPQNSLVQRFHYYSIGLIILFFTCGALATWMINIRLAGT